MRSAGRGREGRTRLPAPTDRLRQQGRFRTDRWAGRLRRDHRIRSMAGDFQYRRRQRCPRPASPRPDSYCRCRCHQPRCSFPGLLSRAAPAFPDCRCRRHRLAPDFVGPIVEECKRLRSLVVDAGAPVACATLNLKVTVSQSHTGPVEQPAPFGVAVKTAVLHPDRAACHVHRACWSSHLGHWRPAPI